MPVPKNKTNIPYPRVGERDEPDYVFPERVVLDEASFAEFSADMANPPEPNAALRTLFKR